MYNLPSAAVVKYCILYKNYHIFAIQQLKKIRKKRLPMRNNSFVFLPAII